MSVLISLQLLLRKRKLSWENKILSSSLTGFCWSSYPQQKPVREPERILFSQDSDPQPEKAMAPHSSTVAWKIPWMGEPGGLQSRGSLEVGHDWATSLSLFTFMHWRRKWQPTPVFLPGESQGRGTWWAAVCGVAQSRTLLKRLSSSSSYPQLQINQISLLVCPNSLSHGD